VATSINTRLSIPQAILIQIQTLRARDLLLAQAMLPWLLQVTAPHSFSSGVLGVAAQSVRSMVVHQARDTTHLLHIILQITPEAQLTNRVLPQEPKGQAYSLQAVRRGRQCLLPGLKYP
jgi:hypothetical protein